MMNDEINELNKKSNYRFLYYVSGYLLGLIEQNWGEPDEFHDYLVTRIQEIADLVEDMEVTQ